ncbi:branched-chain amino acid transport system substrate-binding protein [Rhodoligotrophos appendicifer]|uniref:ABC transporter substrate-binding protein n=1 Tax=Rhodoligotrophos appendicifer TaxID=987056 RepID=UPI00118538E6|nr:ABC transporter substrate-binding protein [Rhodoligotrophos appendicifer]
MIQLLSKGLAWSLLASAIFAAQPATAEEIGITKDTIKIGGMGALTGPFAGTIMPQLNGVEAVFDEVNAAGGIHGRKIVYVKQDDKCLPSEGVGAVKKLIYDEGPFMLVGGGCSNAAIAQKPEIINAKIPWVIVASTADSLTDPANPYIFTSMSAAWMEVYGQLQFALDQGKKNIAVVWQPDAWGKARIAPMLEAFKAKGLEPTIIEEIAVDPVDTTPAALRVQASDADAVLLLLFPKAAIPFLRDASKIGLDSLMIGGSPLADIDILAKGAGSPDTVKNFRALTAAGYGVSDPKVAKWREIIEKKFGDRFNGFHMFGISAGQFAVKALEEAGPDLTREKVIEVMANLKVQTDTYAGPLQCTPSNHQCHNTLGIFAFENGVVTGVGATTPTR